MNEHDRSTMQPAAEAATDVPAQLPYLVTPTLRQRLDLLHHLLEFGRQVIVVEGAPGSGRTRLLQAVADDAPPHWRVVAVNGVERAGAAALLETLALALELPEPGADAGEIRARLAALERGGQRGVLLLDAAADLDVESCALLFELAHSGDERGDLRVVLAVDNARDFSARLQATTPEASLVHVVDVPPLGAEELGELALQALAAHGGPSTLTSGLDLDQVVAASAGNPGRLLASLQPGAQTTATVIGALMGALAAFDVRKYAAAMAAAAFVLVAVVVGVLWLTQHAERGQAGTVEITLPSPVPSPSTVGPATGARPDGVSAGAREATPSDLPEPARPATPAPSPAATPTPNVPSEAAAATHAAESSAAIGPAVVPGNDRPASPAVTAPFATPAPAVAIATIPLAPPHPKTPAAPATSVPTDGVNAYSAHWLRTQKAQSYVIQLFAARERAAATRFIASHGLGDKAAVIAITLEHQPWYVVVAGLYPSRAAATTAIHALPPALAKQHPWPRTVASLHP